MVSNFGAEATQVSVDPSQRPVTPGVQTPGISVKMVGDIFSSISGAIEGDKKKKATQTVADFTRTQLLVADALEQGQIPNSAYARSVMRKNLLDAIEANPSLAGDLISAQSSIVDLAGGADIVKEGDETEQLWKAEREDLVSKGMISPDASDDEVRAASAKKRSLAALTEEHRLRQETIDMRLKDLSLSAAERSELQAQRSENAYGFVQKIAPDELVRVRSELDKIVNGSGTSVEKQQAIEAFYTQFLSDATAVTLGLKTEDTAVFLKPFESLKADYLKRASGEYSDEDLKRSIERATNTQTLLLIADPEIARAVATSKLLGDGAMSQVLTNSPSTLSKFAQFMATGSTTTDPSGDKQVSPYTVDTSTREGLASYLKLSTEALNSSDPEAKAEAEDRVARVLSSMVDYEGLVNRNPKAGIELVNWLASPEFASAVSKNPALRSQVEAAKEVLGRNYSDEVWGMIDREFTNNSVTKIVGTQLGKPLSATLQTTELVQTVSDASGMKFVPVNPDDSNAVAKAKELNKTLKPVINTQLRAMAHLEGRTDYGAYWEEAAGAMLGTETGTDEGDDVSIDDFLQNGVLDQAMATGGFVGNGDFSKAETPADVAASFIGFSEGAERNVLSSFIEKTTGGSIDPQVTAWCAAFVNAALGAKGVEGTNALAARSFLDWGVPTTEPTQGDVVVLWRDSPESGKGHVGFYVGPSEREGYIKILGGNQGKDGKVSIEDFPIKRVLGYRQPQITGA